MICGTSTGGIIAAALGLGIPANTILSLYLQEGADIFPAERAKAWPLAHKTLKGQIDTPLHDRRPLDEKLAREFDAYSFGDSVARLVIPSFDENIEPNIWRTDHHPDYKQDWSLPANAPVAATSAAPVYLAGYTGTDRVQWDGGLFANNPIMMGVVDALTCYALDRDNVRILSLGCGNAPLALPAAESGLPAWGLKLQKATGKLQNQDAIGQAGLLIGRHNIIRIDPDLAVDLPLDGYQKAAELLPELARNAYSSYAGGLAAFFDGDAAPRERHYSTA